MVSEQIILVDDGRFREMFSALFFVFLNRGGRRDVEQGTAEIPSRSPIPVAQGNKIILFPATDGPAGILETDFRR